MRPRRGSEDHRKLIMPVDLRNLIMLPGMGPEWVRPGGGGPTKAVGFMPRRTRHRKDVPPLRECERALTAGQWWRAPHVEAGITGT